MKKLTSWLHQHYAVWCNSFSFSSHRGHVFKVQTTPQATKTNTLHWCCTIESPGQRCFPIPPSLNETSVPEITTLQLWQQREGLWLAGMEGSPDKPFPAGKLAAGHRPSGVCQLGLESIQSQAEPRKVCPTGMKCLKCYICANASKFPHRAALDNQEQLREYGRLTQDHTRQLRQGDKGTG